MKWEEIEKDVRYNGTGGVKTERMKTPHGWIVRITVWSDHGPTGITSQLIHDPVHEWNPED